jgi:hypothetical protein
MLITPKLFDGEGDMAEAKDPLTVFREAVELAQQGKYEEALENHLWFHEHALEHNPSLAGVRLSFALASWLELGEKYPKALRALLSVLDEKVKAITDGNGSFGVFHDLATINEILNESPSTVALFKVVHQAYPDVAKHCYRVAERHLVAQREYTICAAYLLDGVARFEEIRFEFQMKKKVADENRLLRSGGVMEYAEASFVVEVCRLLEILVGVGRRPEAERVETLALELISSAEARDTVGKALRDHSVGNGDKPHDPSSHP